MTDSIRLGRVAGIPIGIHWSVLVIAWLFAWSLASSFLPAEAPGNPPLAYWVAGLAVAALFFASLLAHELAHAVLARRSGVDVDGITLWLLGGVARLKGEAATPAADFRIAAVGPVVSGLLSALFGLAAVGLASVGAPELLTAATAWLARMNIILAAFNLLPGAPLDGGRLLRAVIWRLRGSRREAVVMAARTGSLLGYGLVVIGLFELLVGANLGGLWFVILGFFLSTAASAERRDTETRAALAGLRVRDVMTPDPVVVPSDLGVEAFIRRYAFVHRFASYPVTAASGRLVGLLTIQAVRRAPGGARRITSVAELATPVAGIATVGPDDDLDTLFQRLAAKQGTGRAVVVHNGAPIGIVSPSDIVRTVELGSLREQADTRHPIPS
ncbi:MAG: site-2 protease family protein [Chloroflexota bacterium]